MKKRKRNLCVLLLSILVAAAWSAVVLNVSAYFSHQNEKNNVLKTGDNTSHIGIRTAGSGDDGYCLSEESDGEKRFPYSMLCEGVCGVGSAQSSGFHRF